MMLQRCRQRCAVECSFFYFELLNAVLGSPGALLRLHQIYIAEVGAALFLLGVQIAVFLVFFRDEGMTATTTLTLLVLVPVALCFLQLPSLIHLERRFRQLALAHERQNAAVAAASCYMLRSGRSKRVQFISMFLAAWYAFGIVWNYVGPPCRGLSAPVEFWRLEPRHAPCEVWESICTLLLCSNATLAGLLFLSPKAVQVFQRHFVPTQSQGFPTELLERLPRYVLGAPGAPVLERAEDAEEGEDGRACSICIEAMQDGESVRQLPCGHFFHAACVDQWLTRTASCPLRCPQNLWDATRTDVEAQAPTLIAQSGSPSPAASYASTGAVTAAGSLAQLSSGRSAPELAPAMLGQPRDAGIIST
eukprot:TRINITY_DN13572_c0_g1_i1.p1 TRINITY_DN13572_c0_g1~~TRINITY_DN13572_c0_g1_i1.p1  ORF type:complete len:363 (-),score=64.87 TRINITY_DN13572_c0_g1_i1:9-1097(-)